jgi:O-antigen/teichoic acid export membrane protein
MSFSFAKTFEIIKKNGKSGAFYLMLSSAIAKLFSFVINVILASKLEVSEFGILSYLTGLLALLTTVSGLGLHKSYLRYAAITPRSEPTFFGLALGIGSLWNLLVFGFFILISFYLNDWFLKDSTPYLKWLLIPLMSLYLYELSLNHYLLRRKTVNYALMEGLRLPLIALCIWIISQLDIPLYFFIFGGITLLFSVNVLKKIKQISFSVKKLITQKPLLRYGINSSLSGVISQIMYTTDIFMLGILLQDSEEIGFYKAGIMIPLSFTFISLALVNARYADIAENYRNKKILKPLVKNITYMAFFIAVAIYILLFFFRKDLILWFFGEEFTGGLKVFLPATLTMFAALILRVPFGNILAAVGKTHWNFYISLAGLILNILLNYWLIPSFGIYGASIATLTSVIFTGLASFTAWRIYLSKI